MRIVFMGTPEFSVPSLRALHDAGHEIVAVYTRAPAASGRRGKDLRPSPVHAAADELGLSVRIPKSLHDDEAIASFRDLRAEAAVVIAYGRILPSAVLEATELGCWNAHASLLPRWRGAAPIQRAIMAGDTETGVQIMRMEEGLDTGPIARTHREPIGPTTTAGDLFATLADHAALLLTDAMRDLAAGTLETEPQSLTGVSYADKIAKDETRIDWSRPAVRVAAHINGLSPFPGAWTTLAGGRVKVLRAEAVLDDLGGIPDTLAGEAVRADDGPITLEPQRHTDAGAIHINGAGVSVQCGDGRAVRLHSVQRAGGKAIGGDEFARALPPDARFE